MKLIQSRTVWTIVVMALVSIAQAYEPKMSPDVFTLIMSVLGAMAAYFKVNPSQEY